MSAPLDDITIVEVDSYMAAPSAGAILADLGANIIKVEPLSGDPLRGLSRPIKKEDMEEAKRKYDYGFDVDNRGKKSIAVALDKPEGAELVRRLVSTAQIFMCNLLIKRQEKYRLDPFSTRMHRWFGILEMVPRWDSIQSKAAIVTNLYLSTIAVDLVKHTVHAHNTLHVVI